MTYFLSQYIKGFKENKREKEKPNPKGTRLNRTFTT